MSVWLLHGIGGKAPPATRDSSEVSRPKSLSLSVGFSILNEAMDVVQFAPQGAHYPADVIYMPP